MPKTTKSRQVTVSALLRRLALAGVSTFLLLEVALQIGAWVVWIRAGAAAPPDPTDGGVVDVVCLGDSFTFGLGASARNRSYPSRLAARLSDAMGRRVDIANMGWPGSDSLDVVRRLPRALEREPQFVCVLIGCNDSWRRRGVAPDLESGPAEAQAAQARDEAPPFRWEYRTLGLVRTLIHGRALFADQGRGPGVGEDGLDPGGPAKSGLAGRWILQPAGLPVRVFASGHGKLGEDPFRWRRESGDEGSVLVLSMLGSKAEQRLHLERSGAHWLLRDGAGHRLVLEAEDSRTPRTVNTSSQLRAADKSRQDGDVVAARAAYLEVLDQVGVSLANRRDARLGLVLLGDDSGFSAERRAQIGDELRREAAQGLDSEDCVAAMRALQVTGRARAALDLFDEWAVSGRDITDHGWIHAALIARNLAPVAERAERIEAMLAHVPLDSPNRRWALGEATRGFRDPELRAGFLGRAWLEVMDPEWRVERLRSLRVDADVEVVRQAFREAGLDQHQADELVGAWQKAHASEPAGDGWQQALEQHLGWIVAQCRARDAEPFLLTYPFRRRDTAEIVHAVCDREGVVCVDVEKAFPEKQSERVTLFVADGHCNDEGYDRMAEAVAESVAARMRR